MSRRRGLKNVGVKEPGHIFRGDYWQGYSGRALKAYPVFMNPWVPQESRDSPNGAETFTQALKTLVASFLYGLFALMAAELVLSGADSILIKSLIHAFVIGIGAYLTTYTWTTDNNNLPIMVDPAVAVSYWFNSQFGLLAVFLWSILIFGGHAAAGGVAYALGLNTVVSSNNVASASIVGIAVLFGIMTVFSWIFNDHFEEDFEKETNNQSRYTLSYAVAAFLTTLVLTSQGVYFFNAALYLGSAISTGGWNNGLPGTAPWAYWVFGQWFVYGVGAGLLYWLFIGLKSWAAGRGFFGRFYNSGGADADDADLSEQPAELDMQARVAGSYSGSARLRQRQPVVNF